MKSLQDYTIVIRPDNNGTFVAYVPVISGCHAWEQTPDEARYEILKQLGITEEDFNQLQ